MAYRGQNHVHGIWHLLPQTSSPACAETSRILLSAPNAGVKDPYFV